MSNPFSRLFKTVPQADPKIVHYLKKQPLFSRAPETILAQLSRQVKMRSLDKGDILLRQNETSVSLFMIRSGWVKVVVTGAKGEEVVLNQYGPGQIIGEMSLIDHSPSAHTVIALRPTEALEIKYDDVRKLLNEYPQLAVSFLQEMANRVRFANTYIEESIAWCRRVAAGDYGFVQEQIEQAQSTIVDTSHSDQARASAFLSVFFKMAQDIQKREEALRRQVQQLIIEIDQVKRQREVKAITESDSFETLQMTAQKLRAKRQERLSQETGESETVEEDEI
jgi:CRP-like cAMP-binding protein